MAEMKARVKAHSENPTKTIVKTRHFEIIVDEPANIGGTDHGATPVEFLLAAFAGCLNVVGHVIAKEMGFELRKIEINIDGSLNPNKFMGIDNKVRAGFNQINVSIKPDCDADETTLSKWLKYIEERCPISDNIQHETPVKIEISK